MDVWTDFAFMPPPVLTSNPEFCCRIRYQKLALSWARTVWMTGALAGARPS